MPSTLERELLNEISRIDRDIAELANERRTLEGLLITVRHRALGGKEVTRSNSVPRLMAESAILEHLRRAGIKRSVASKQLYMTVQRTVPRIGRSTFASYLNRLKERGLVENPAYGVWRLTEAGAKIG